MNTKLFCYYHSKDLDGIACGAILQACAPIIKESSKYYYDNTKPIIRGYDYGEPFNIEEHRGHFVIMADVSLPIEDMVALNNVAQEFTWIDHHASAIKEYLENEDLFKNGDFTPVLKVGVAACELAAKHFMRGKIPYGITLLGQYDTWRKDDIHLWEEEVLPFQFGMRMRCNSLEQFPTEILFINDSGVLYQIIAEGKAILKYQEQQNEIRCRDAFETTLFGLRAICLNCPGLNSLAFKSVYDPEKHDIMVPFFYEGHQWKFSLYTDKDINVGDIAKTMGGGGHKQAAGFKVKHLQGFMPQIVSPNFDTFQDEFEQTLP